MRKFSADFHESNTINFNKIFSDGKFEFSLEKLSYCIDTVDIFGQNYRN